MKYSYHHIISPLSSCAVFIANNAFRGLKLHFDFAGRLFELIGGELQKEPRHRKIASEVLKKAPGQLSAGFARTECVGGSDVIERVFERRPSSPVASTRLCDQQSAIPRQAQISAHDSGRAGKLMH